MSGLAEPLARLIAEFKRMPGIGAKSAQRMAFYVLRTGRDDAERLSQAILDVKDKLGLCVVCNNITDSELCVYCNDPNRDDRVVCVVEEPHSIIGIETTGGFRGRYHVLHGSLSPLRGIGPDALKIKGLGERIGAGGVVGGVVAAEPAGGGGGAGGFLGRPLEPPGGRGGRGGGGSP